MWERNGIPADGEGERSSEDLSGEDAEKGREKTEEDGSACFKENSRWQTESDGDSVDGDVKRDSPNP